MFIEITFFSKVINESLIGIKVLKLKLDEKVKRKCILQKQVKWLNMYIALKYFFQ